MISLRRAERDVTAAPWWQRLLVPRGPEDDAATFLQRAIAGQSFDRDACRRLTNTSSDNINAMARAALAVAGAERFPVPAAAWGEWGSYAFYASWTWPAYAAAADVQEDVRPICRAMAAWALLHWAPSVRGIRLVTPAGTWGRDRLSGGGMDAYQGGLSASPGSRQLWPRTGALQWVIERQLVGRALEGAGLDFDHPDLGWAARVLRERRRHFLGSTPADLSALRVRSGWRYWIWRHTGGWVAAVSESPRQTRGPVQATAWDAATETLSAYSASSETGSAGQWHRAVARVEGGRLLLDCPATGGNLEIRLPEVEPATWDEQGWRDPVAEPPPPPRPDDPRVTEALVLLDAALRDVDDPWADRHSRTAAEVLRRTIAGRRPEALLGARHLVAQIEQDH